MIKSIFHQKQHIGTHIVYVAFMCKLKIIVIAILLLIINGQHQHVKWKLKKCMIHIEVIQLYENWNEVPMKEK